MNYLKKIITLLSARERKNGVLLFFMILVMAFLDVAGIASILPFVAVLTNPGIIETNFILITIYKFFNFTNQESFLFFLGVMVFLLLIFSLCFKALTGYAQLRFVYMREYSLGKRFVEGYLHQPYIWFLNHHSSDIGKTVLSEISQFIGSSLLPFITFVSQSIIAIAIIILLILVDPKLSMIIGGVLVIMYGLIFKLVSKYLSSEGERRLKANQQRFMAINEAFGSIKEVKVNSLEEYFIGQFSPVASVYAKTLISSQMVTQLPRFALEAVAFGGMTLIILYLMTQSNDISTVLPIISLYALAGYRLMPALQMIYASLAKLRFSGPVVDALYADWISLKKTNSIGGLSKEKIPLQGQMHLDGIFFSYPKAKQPTLKDISLTISAYSMIGLVGLTGSGKTTLMDFMLGLLKQQKGRLTIDGKVIDNTNRHKWRESIGYVPQQIYLSDDSVAANIAFGIEPCKIDQAAVERAAKASNLHEFVVNELPKGYETMVGERGVRLSGGQRQRIGIARALYRNPNVLFLDEATSALDNLTENRVMEAINCLHHKITIIIIAHRLDTVRQCDNIFILDQGKVKAQGAYNDLMQKSKIFQTMNLSTKKEII